MWKINPDLYNGGKKFKYAFIVWRQNHDNAKLYEKNHVYTIKNMEMIFNESTIIAWNTEHDFLGWTLGVAIGDDKGTVIKARRIITDCFIYLI